MNKNYQGLAKIKEQFQPYIDNKDLWYSFIAPKDFNEYEKFKNIVLIQPTWTNSSYETRNNDEIVVGILDKYFSDDTELEIYMATKDLNTALVIKCTLREYIAEMKINFKY